MESGQTTFALHMLNLSIRRHIDHSRIKQEMDHATGTHGWVICYLAEHENEDVFQRDLEKRFRISRSTCSKLITLMEKNGMIQRSHVAGDERLKKLVLTKRAKQYVEQFRTLNARVEGELLTGFSEEERQQLLQYLSRMQQNINLAGGKENPCLKPSQDA